MGHLIKQDFKSNYIKKGMEEIIDRLDKIILLLEELNKKK